MLTQIKSYLKKVFYIGYGFFLKGLILLSAYSCTKVSELENSVARKNIYWNIQIVSNKEYMENSLSNIQFYIYKYRVNYFGISDNDNKISYNITCGEPENQINEWSYDEKNNTLRIYKIVYKVKYISKDTIVIQNINDTNNVEALIKRDSPKKWERD